MKIARMIDELEGFTFTYTLISYLNCFGGRGSGGLGMIFSMFSLWKCSFLDAMIAKMWQHLLPLCGQYWQPGACTKIPRLHSDTNQPNKAPLAGRGDMVLH